MLPEFFLMACRQPHGLPPLSLDSLVDYRPPDTLILNHTHSLYTLLYHWPVPRYCFTLRDNDPDRTIVLPAVWHADTMHHYHIEHLDEMRFGLRNFVDDMMLLGILQHMD